MNNLPRISYLAIASLVLGMAFYVPLVTGILAIGFGVFAIRAIKNADKVLLGKGLAVSGILLGAVHSVLWGLIMFAGLTYTVDVGETGLVIRGNVPVRSSELGVHYKIPFYEHVERFPTAHIYSLESNSEKYIFKSKKILTVNSKLLWKVCDPALVYKKFGAFDKSIIEFRLDYITKDILRDSAIRSHSVAELANNYDVIEEKLSRSIEDKGICLTSFIIVRN